MPEVIHQHDHAGSRFLCGAEVLLEKMQESHREEARKDAMPLRFLPETHTRVHIPDKPLSLQ
ncbi:hypothetical protein ACJU26_10000 [Acidithiobacillus sp. M4-SHS-6]|uniref:hypothetical protein n=1 Tax=Acidithiobacillus sp. M4-SHS-6 TaxID=3383024 RepID=UPI0039BDFF50